MRDVSPEAKNSVDFRELLLFLREFIKHPAQKISHLPDWNWPSLFVFHILLSIVSGVLAGMLKLSGWAIAAGIFLMPIVSTICVLLMSLFLYYYFQFFESRTENFRRITIFVILASIPFYLFQILSEYFSPISLVGFAFTSLLGVIGLCDNFRVERKRAYHIAGGMFALALVAWLSNQFN